MKIRTDFVTNSSSSSFSVVIAVNGHNGEMVELCLDPTDAYVGGGGEAIPNHREKKVLGANTLDELVTYLTDNVVFDDAGIVFEEFDVSIGGGSVKDIRKALKKCEEPEPYFENVMSDIETFRTNVMSTFPNMEAVASVRVDSKHFAWGEFADLLESYLEQIGISVLEDGDSWIEDKTFVVTGKLEYFENRDALVEFIEDEGGMVAGSVSKLTNYLINNDVSSTSSKNKKALELGIPVISEREFILRFCDPDSLEEEIIDKLEEFPEFRERIIAMLKEHLTPESSFEELADCIEEYCEPTEFSGIETVTYDMDNKITNVAILLTYEDNFCGSTMNRHEGKWNC